MSLGCCQSCCSEGYEEVICGRSAAASNTTRSTTRPSRTVPLPPVRRRVRRINFPPSVVTVPMSVGCGQYSHAGQRHGVIRAKLLGSQTRLTRRAIHLERDSPSQQVARKANQFPPSVFTVQMSLACGQSFGSEGYDEVIRCRSDGPKTRLTRRCIHRELCLSLPAGGPKRPIHCQNESPYIS
jgi:hypothetical protein